MLFFIVILSGACSILICSKLRIQRCVVLKQHYRKFLQQAEQHSARDQPGNGEQRNIITTAIDGNCRYCKHCSQNGGGCGVCQSTHN